MTAQTPNPAHLTGARPASVMRPAAWRMTLAAAAFTAVIGPAAAQSVTSAPPPPADLSLAQSRIVDLERALRENNAAMDQVMQENFRLRLENDRLKQALDAAQGAIATVGAPVGPTTPTASAPIIPSAPRAATVSAPPPPPPQPAIAASEDAAFNTATALLARRDYPGAEAAFLNFVRTYPNSARTGEANYFYARALFVQLKYNAASAVFMDIVERTPRAPRAPDAMVWLGAAIRNDGAATGNPEKIRIGCDTIRELTQKFPSASQRTRQEAQMELTRAATPGGPPICRSGS